MEHLPYEEGIKTPGGRPVNDSPLILEHLPYEEGIKTCARATEITRANLEHLPYEEGIKTILRDDLIP